MKETMLNRISYIEYEISFELPNMKIFNEKKY